jgi:ribosome biogenesis GTPase
MSIDLSSLGWDEAFAATYARLDRADLCPARVSQVDPGVCTVLTASGPVRVSFSGSLLAEAAADRTALPCAGDWVVVRTWPDARLTMETVLRRRNAIVRAAGGEGASGRPLAANLDAVAVVEPLDRTPDLGRIARLLALAGQSGAHPLVVLTKADLVTDPAAVAGRVAEASAGVEVFAVSARTGRGVKPLKTFIAYGRTLALLGPGGSGKSTLVSALVGTPVIGGQAVGSPRRVRSVGRSGQAMGQQRQAGSHRALVPLPDGGAVLDAPDALSDMPDIGLDTGLVESIVVGRPSGVPRPGAENCHTA